MRKLGTMPKMYKAGMLFQVGTIPNPYLLAVHSNDDRTHPMAVLICLHTGNRFSASTRVEHITKISEVELGIISGEFRARYICDMPQVLI